MSTTPAPCFDTINKLFLELSQVATATTAKELSLRNLLTRANDLLRSMHAIVEREGRETNWAAFKIALETELIVQRAVLPPPPSDL